MTLFIIILISYEILKNIREYFWRFPIKCLVEYRTHLSLQLFWDILFLNLNFESVKKNRSTRDNQNPQAIQPITFSNIIMEIVRSFMYRKMDLLSLRLTQVFHVRSETRSWLNYESPLSSPPKSTGWTTRSITVRGNCNLNWRQFFPCHNDRSIV